MCAASLTEAELELGWKFCNGVGTFTRAGRTFNVPDLRDRFIIAGGSDNYPIGTFGGSHQATTSSNGAHTPTITVDNTTLTESHLPNHTHSNLDECDRTLMWNGGPNKWSVHGDHHPVGGSQWIANTGGSTAHAHTATSSAIPNHSHIVEIIQLILH